MSFSDSENDDEDFRKAASSTSESKLLSSIETYGSNSYYYAHRKSKEFAVPDGAIVVEGPGIITGGAPVRLEASAGSETSVFRRKIEKYSWSDDGDNVRIYVDDPNILPCIADSEESVSCNFQPKSLCLEIRQSCSVVFGLDINTLNDEIDPTESSFKVSLGKRVTVTLKKANAAKWSSLKKN